jgi:hypothetical protein
MNFLHQEKTFAIMKPTARLILLVNPLTGAIAAQPAAVRLPGLSLTPRNPGQVLHKPHALLGDQIIPF